MKFFARIINKKTEAEYKSSIAPKPVLDTELIIATFFCFNINCVKSARIRSYSGPYFPAFGLMYSVRIRENADQNNSEYGHFSGSGF